MNVVVVVVRGWPLGYLGCYGNSWIATPTMDEFASAGVTFDLHFADAVDVSDLRRTWMTGRTHLPNREHNSGPNLLDVLREKGVPTYLIEDADHPSAWPDTSGWHDVDRVEAEPGDASALPVTLDAACSRLEQFEPDAPPWLMWVELSTLLAPWHPPREYLDAYFTERIDETEEGLEIRHDPLEPMLDPVVGPFDPEDDELFERIQNSFAATVSYVDAALGELLTTASERGLLDDTAVIITSDRGQALGEHDRVGDNGPSVHEEIVHVPLVVRLPKGEEPGRRVLGLTTGVDLPVTLASLFGVSLDGSEGIGWMPLMKGEVEEVRPHLVTAHQVGDQSEWLLRTPEWALLRREPYNDEFDVRLFAKPEDRWEVNDVRAHYRRDLETLEETLLGYSEKS